MHSLLLGTAATAAASLALGSLVVGCADENEPETHVKRLSDPSTRAASVSRLIQFFEDAMTRDNKDRNGPTVKPLLDMIVAPMTQACVAGDLDERTNSKLIKFLSDTRDPRAEACLVKALKDYKPGSTDEDVRWTCRAVGAMKLKSAAAPLFEVFTKVKASDPKGGGLIYRDVNDAMIALQDPSWKQGLLDRLAHPVDTKNKMAMTDEAFWQIVSAEILGDMKAPEAIKPLLKLVLSPSKRAAGTSVTAVNALVKIGKPSVAPTVALLKGEDQDLVNYSKVESLKELGDKANDAAKKTAENAYIGVAAAVLSMIGREECTAPLLDAMNTKMDEGTKATVARELPKLPKSEAVETAFKDAYEKTSPSANIEGAGARESMLDASTYFFDSELVPWYVKTAKNMKGEDSDLEPIREASLQAMLKVMKANQVDQIDELANIKGTAEGKPTTVGKGFEKEIKLTKDLLTECGDKIECYIGKISDSKANAQDTQFIGVKAAYMIGVLGKPEVRAQVVSALPKASNTVVRGVAVFAVEFLSPKGDKAIADSLQKLVDANEASKDGNKTASDPDYRRVIYRLNARAQ
ncbi:MAG TPA: hypothetical protein VGM56_24385 [Byssovorax sp.]